jgi:dihydrolipoamide dehydrogenase
MGDAYDVVVIGAGSTGENVADRAVRGGLTAVMVEAELIGGDCSYWACMPSKVLLRGPEALAAARAIPGAAGAVTGGVDAAATLRRRDAFAAHWSDTGQVEWARSRGIDVVRGRGRVTGPRRVLVTGAEGDRDLTARHAVAVCTGSVPALPPIDGLADARPWTTREATSAQEIPASMIVLGGGAAGCELATAYAALGAHVSIVEAADRLLPNMEAFAGELVEAALRDLGVDVCTGTRVTAVDREGDGPTTVFTTGGDLSAQVLLVSTGRRPRLDGLGLDAFGLSEAAWLPVDDACRVSGVDGGWLYAVGDVNGRHLFTHQGKYQARLCGDAIVAAAHGRPIDTTDWSAHAATADRLAAPAVVFTDPQVATVGRTQAQAAADGLDARAVDYEIGSVAGAALRADGYTGHARIIVDTARRVIVGATLVGPDVGELIHSATIAIVGEVPLERLWHAVPAYPTVSEIWLRLLEAYGL